MSVLVTVFIQAVIIFVIPVERIDYNIWRCNIIRVDYKVIEFYKTDMPNDDAGVMEFMKTATVEEILANEDLWDEDLSRFADKIKELTR